MHSWIIAVWFLFLGLGVGSFLNVVIDRAQSNRGLGGRSACDFCHKTLLWFDLIPVLSYVFLGGKCRFCSKRLSLQYPLVEALTGLLYVLVFLFFWQAQPLYFISMLCIVTLSVVIAITDMKYQIIPDWAVVLLFLIGISINIDRIFYYFAGSLIGVFFLWIIYHLSQGKAMGYGDVKLIAAQGMILSLPFLFISLYISFLLGGLYSVPLLAMRKKKMTSQIPFGPFLVIGFLISTFVSYGW
ncbi:MAG: prepilin peptidase [Candidatus Roizmanbacteria bacterium]|nr:prepilin peptidase [Candidatus Roizmanbacteria bacterium]